MLFSAHLLFKDALYHLDHGCPEIWKKYCFKTNHYLASDFEVDFVIKEKGEIEIVQVCIDLHEKAEVREVRALVQAAKELKLEEGILITADIEKEWEVEGIRVHAIPLYKYVL